VHRWPCLRELQVYPTIQRWTTTQKCTNLSPTDGYGVSGFSLFHCRRPLISGVVSMRKIFDGFSLRRVLFPNRQLGNRSLEQSNGSQDPGIVRNIVADRRNAETSPLRLVGGFFFFFLGERGFLFFPPPKHLVKERVGGLGTGGAELTRWRRQKIAQIEKMKKLGRIPAQSENGDPRTFACPLKIVAYCGARKSPVWA